MSQTSSNATAMPLHTNCTKELCCVLNLNNQSQRKIIACTFQQGAPFTLGSIPLHNPGYFVRHSSPDAGLGARLASKASLLLLCTSHHSAAHAHAAGCP